MRPLPVHATGPSGVESPVLHQAYTPEVVRHIIWAIIVDTLLFFDNIKPTEDFIHQGHYMQFPASRLVEGDLMSIKHGIKLQRHNFPHEWTAPDVQPGPQYYPGKGGGEAITFPPVSPAALRAHGPSILHLPHQIHHRTTGGLQALLTNAIQR